MGNVQAQCLDYSLALFEIADIFFIDVFCKQDIICLLYTSDAADE